ncbi:hypothetical protein NUW54_g1847 [Trametes sanguinea]|uniref:Uncharacterized protein n=1 Tax=Trametes sanguinea TaxID=158606 RepID=A0ACC1Q727_9APHY|nr:hypothetical protein NUW54_g1847 [Trametes sanguinea]
MSKYISPNVSRFAPMLGMARDLRSANGSAYDTPRNHRAHPRLPPRRPQSAREVLEEFRSVKIPREYVFDLFPPLRPRQFSIANSVKTHPRKIHLCIAIVQYRTMLKIPRRGVCTSWLAGLKPGDQLQIGVQKGFITLPPDLTTPVICVGPGTGVAPMRAIIQERIHDGNLREHFVVFLVVAQAVKFSGAWAYRR